ncbi:MAG: cobalt-precorrin 5A hydrolase [Methanobacterium sp.]|uniref:cobalt-precorrin 5A hydrolase n=1 Tax=Methanobacterium sp. TaxID=2164 RepID=UPI003D64620F|nr:cobalt-precorrin 5A hydrolase [Methanobacterium sp.]
MKIAIFTITKDAQDVAFNLKKVLDEDSTVIKVGIFHKNVKETLKYVFRDYDCIIGIMATGIMVRNICGLIRDKIEDPAVLVMDDQAKHVISLLSGHFGGANEITLKIAEISGADPVITTATDIHGKIGIDSLARRYHLEIDDPKKIMTINSALVNNKTPDLYVPSKFEFIFNDPLIKNSYNLLKFENKDLKAVFEDTEIVLKPKKLVVGIGARKAVLQLDVKSAVESAINALNLSLDRIDMLATAEVKKNEVGIIETAMKLDIPLEIISLDKLKDFKDPQCAKSLFVEGKFGIPGVCEPSALIAAGNNSKLIFRKTAFNGVTIAVAVSSN